jgi:hypothetical protein
VLSLIAEKENDVVPLTSQEKQDESIFIFGPTLGPMKRESNATSEEVSASTRNRICLESGIKEIRIFQNVTAPVTTIAPNQ